MEGIKFDIVLYTQDEEDLSSLVGNYFVAFLKEDVKFEKGVRDEIKFIAGSRVLGVAFFGLKK